MAFDVPEALRVELVDTLKAFTAFVVRHGERCGLTRPAIDSFRDEAHHGPGLMSIVFACPHCGERLTHTIADADVSQLMQLFPPERTGTETLMTDKEDADR